MISLLRRRSLGFYKHRQAKKADDNKNKGGRVSIRHQQYNIFLIGARSACTERRSHRKYIKTATNNSITPRPPSRETVSVVLSLEISESPSPPPSSNLLRRTKSNVGTIVLSELIIIDLASRMLHRRYRRFVAKSSIEVLAVQVRSGKIDDNDSRTLRLPLSLARNNDGFLYNRGRTLSFGTYWMLLVDS